ncbi:MAG: host nuclease inhibitor protein [Pseudomonas sp.]|uniref:host nuclease inhibitor protein n=1 Tax=Pseudomonas sp. TaxID=306 RepID=UPI0027327677|nr:host nuclease inhibitor protein [Pseudomonas sp.]MDP3848401.1 host nuclease inhibitor protein [Pseudomonas sp.]
MSNQNAITIDSLMSQASVYASAWSLVGGKFDQGNQLQVAEEEKVRLEEMLEDFHDQAEANAELGNLQEIAEGLVAWHQQRIKNINTILDAPAGTTLQLGKDDSDPLVLEGELRKGFRCGLIIAKEWFEPFPLSIQKSGNKSDLDEEV